MSTMESTITLLAGMATLLTAALAIAIPIISLKFKNIALELENSLREKLKKELEDVFVTKGTLEHQFSEFEKRLTNDIAHVIAKILEEEGFVRKT